MSKPPPNTRSADVRQRGFARRWRVEDALAWLDQQVRPLAEEWVNLRELSGRVLAQDVVSEVDVPGFARAMMDGFALRSADTQGASTYNRLTLSVVGESMPGSPSQTPAAPGRCIRIMTGAPMPPGADAVLPVERVEDQGPQIAVLDQVTPGKNVGRVGEDIAAASQVFRAGRLLRPQDLGVLSSIGVSRAPVIRAPRVRIVATGNELLPAGSKPREHHIVDANSPMLAAFIRRDGGRAIEAEIVPDSAEAILEALRDDADVILVSGGSSVGREDWAPVMLAQHGQLDIHGIAMRPSSPAGMGRLEGRFVFLLPGNPVSCLCAYDFFAGRAIRVMGGRGAEWPYRTSELPLRRKLVSVVGRTDYARVKIVDGGIEPLAIGGASVLSSTTRADGFVIIPDDSEGYPAQTLVTMYLY